MKSLKTNFFKTSWFWMNLSCFESKEKKAKQSNERDKRDRNNKKQMNLLTVIKWIENELNELKEIKNIKLGVKWEIKTWKSNALDTMQQRNRNFNKFESQNLFYSIIILFPSIFLFISFSFIFHLFSSSSFRNAIL